MPVHKTTCPHCRKVLRSRQPLRPGKNVRCPQCGTPFTIPRENGTSTPPLSTNVPVPPPELIESSSDAPGVPGTVSFQRLYLVLAGVFLLVCLGGALAGYCIALNRPKGLPPVPSTPLPAAQATPALPALITLPEDEQSLIDQAINRGVRFLKTTQNQEGRWGGGEHAVGYAALPGLVLLECGLPAGDPQIQKAAEFVRKREHDLRKTYELSLAILFLDLLADPKDRELIQILALRLVAGQSPTGTWNYDCPALPAEDHKKLFQLLKDMGPVPFPKWIKSQAPGTTPPLDWKNRWAVLQDLEEMKDEQFRQWSGDNSNTQFAILALWVARRHEVPVQQTLARMDRHFRNSQNANGRWFYSPGSEVSGSWPTMTAAGLLGLAIGHGLAGETRPAEERRSEDPAIDKGLEALAQPIEHVPQFLKKGSLSHDKKPLANLYFLWSVERVAMIFHLQKIAGKDWYLWGANMLLQHQDQHKGNWSNGGYPGSSPVLDTCFALLFLRQANLAKDLTGKVQLLVQGNKRN